MTYIICNENLPCIFKIGGILEKYKILLVDDDKAGIRLLEKVLNKDYDIEIASNGEIGFKRALELKPDLIISDIQMPVMDGIQLTKELKNNESTKNIPIILVTAFNIYDKEAENSGCDGFFSKPIILPKLKEKIKEFLK